jgi:hypothetical protein
MHIPYKTMVRENREDIKVISDDIEHCCDEMASNFGHRVAFQIDPSWHNGDIFVGLMEGKGMGMEIASVQFDYCPFCGSDIVFDHLGKFERVVSERKVSE